MVDDRSSRAGKGGRIQRGEEKRERERRERKIKRRRIFHDTHGTLGVGRKKSGEGRMDSHQSIYRSGKRREERRKKKERKDLPLVLTVVETRSMRLYVDRDCRWIETTFCPCCSTATRPFFSPDGISQTRGFQPVRDEDQ